MLNHRRVWPAVMPAITDWMDRFQIYQAKELYFWSAVKKHAPPLRIIKDFSLNYRNDVPPNNDPIYIRFINLIETMLLTAYRYGFDHKVIDYNLVYTLAILGSLHPVHIPESINACDIIKKVLAKLIPGLKAKRVELKLHHCDSVEETTSQCSDEDDTLYYYLLFEVVRQNRDYSDYAYDPHHQYR